VIEAYLGKQAATVAPLLEVERHPHPLRRDRGPEGRLARPSTRARW
jgi:hypothetical protein